MSKFLKSLVVSSIVFALGAPAIASADLAHGVKAPAVKVSYADLNLDKAAGAKVLYRRLQIAAKQACGVQSFKREGSLANTLDRRSCYRETLAAAVKKVDNDNVSKIHAG